MFDRGIGDGFVEALKRWDHWGDITCDRDLFVGMRKDSINIYYQGCSLFKISFKEGRLISETHYKYLVHPNVKDPYVSWDGERPALEGREKEILIHEFKLDLLKKSSCWYAEDEKVGVHSILKSNRNVVDVEIALSPNTDDDSASEDQNPKGRRVADRIDFAAIQSKGGEPCIVFFEAKRFHNGELRSHKPEPRVVKQIRKYEAFIKQYHEDLEKSYRKICKNLVDLLPPNRYDPLVKVVADRPEQLKVDSEVRLVVFDYSDDENDGEDWKKHKGILEKHFKTRLLMKGNPRGFIKGISDKNLKVAP
jgi:hypothetical protein